MDTPIEGMDSIGLWNLTEPHNEGTMKSLVFVQYCINLDYVKGRVSPLCTGHCRHGKRPHMAKG